MTNPVIRCDDGALYENYMGVWSHQAGNLFLDWLNPPAQHAWLDIGCGNGAFTQNLLQRCDPVSVLGVDPSPEQIAYAQQRFQAGRASFQQGDAMALPLPDQCVNQAVMALVIFFVPEPARGVAEMARVLRPGGTASAYAWDMAGGGFPWAAIQNGMRSIGITPNAPPSPQASDINALQTLWQDAGFTAVETCTLNVQRRFASFEDYWRIGVTGPSMAGRMAQLNDRQRADLKDAVRAVFDSTAGEIVIHARAHGVKGHQANKK